MKEPIRRNVGDRVLEFGPIGPNINLDEEEVYLSDGTRLTEAEAEAMATRMINEVERRRGRPSISGEAARTPNLTVRVTPDVRAALETIAERQGKRLADVSREALSEYVERHAS